MDQSTADSFSRKLSDFAEGLDEDGKRLLDSVLFYPTRCTKVVRALQISPHIADAEAKPAANVVGASQVILLRDDQLRFDGSYLGKKFDLLLCW